MIEIMFRNIHGWPLAFNESQEVSFNDLHVKSNFKLCSIPLFLQSQLEVLAQQRE